MISNTDFKAIAELDLDPIKVKLMHKESGEGWTLDYANQVEFEYRRFLYLMKMFPNDQAAPMFDVDIFWHYHILDTMKYAVDCEEVFGYFLHHFPYVGLRGEDDEAAHLQAGAHMQRLYEDTFDEPYIRDAQHLAGSAQARDAATRTAWSISASTTAWSIRVATDSVKTGDAAVAMTRAWPMNVGKTAWSIQVAPNSVQTGNAALAMKRERSSDAGKTAWSIRVTADSRATPAAARTLDRFYSERPTLAAV